MIEESSLQKQKEQIPNLMDAAIEAGDVSEIVKLRKQDQALGLWIEAEQLASIKNEIKSKQEEKKSADQSLQELEPELVKAKHAFLEAYKIAEDKYSAYAQIQVKAFALDQQHATVTEDLQTLNRTLIQMKNKLHGDGEKQ